MEGINSQIGQTFAVDTRPSVDVNNRRESAELSVESSVDTSTRQNGVSTPARDTTDRTQGNQRSADTLTGEQRPVVSDVEGASREIEQFLQSQNRNLAFSVDQDSQRSVVTVTEADSGEVIRQIPSEEVLRLAERLRDLQTDVGSSVGVLFNNQV